MKQAEFEKDYTGTLSFVLKRVVIFYPLSFQPFSSRKKIFYVQERRCCCLLLLLFILSPFKFTSTTILIDHFLMMNKVESHTMHRQKGI